MNVSSGRGKTGITGNNSRPDGAYFKYTLFTMNGECSHAESAWVDIA